MLDRATHRTRHRTRRRTRNRTRNRVRNRVRNRTLPKLRETVKFREERFDVNQLPKDIVRVYGHLR